MSQRPAILAAARAAFAANGVEPTSVEEIRRDAGASTGSLYHHFPTKAHLVAAVYVELLREYQQAFLEVLDSCVDAGRAVRETVGFHVRWCVEHRPEAALLFTERLPEPAGGSAREVDDANREFLHAVQRWYEPHVHYGAARRLPVELLLALWLGPAHELCRLWVGGRSRHDPREAIDTLAEAAWRSLRCDDERTTT